ncbi:MAG: glycosyltransferase [Methylobacter sp.]|nr:glycosyltransferase [Methylobacter sp.]MDP2428612.1 glycosyltransferase [Methylobacter sp.]MDP3056448.1 glycosyltransferase [Methylobacter sp.]MDP3363194.1 glycosyltransferase [Methylobacter sp.]
MSVIIPSYNRRDLLRRALLSVYAQTLLPTEITVIDDGSTDGTEQMLHREFPQVAYCYQENNGVSAARNRGIEQSSGNWLAFLDSDDEWLPEKLATQKAALSAHPDYKICHTEENWIRHGVQVRVPKKYAKSGGWIFNQCLPLCAVSPSTLLIKRSVLHDIGVFDTTLPACEDYDLWLRIAANYPVLLVAQPQINKHGGHEDQLSMAFWGMDRFRISALQKIIDGGQLSEQNQQAAVAMLLKKAAIYLNGVSKRGKTDEADYYQRLIERYE